VGDRLALLLSGEFVSHGDTNLPEA
jgi:hypothetical protein